MSGAADKKSAPTISEGPISTRAELKQVEERVAIGANVVYETIRREGEEELHRTVSALAWSALAAGLSMGFSFIAEALLMSHLPDEPWRTLIDRFGYSINPKSLFIPLFMRSQYLTA